MTGTPPPDGSDAADAGSEETLRGLLALVQGWAQRTMPEPPSGHPGPECEWCPLCQFAALLRGDHPDLTAKLAEAGSAVAVAVRALTESAAARASGPSKPQPTPRVVRIDLDAEPPHEDPAPRPHPASSHPAPSSSAPSHPAPSHPAPSHPASARVQRIRLDDESGETDGRER